MYEKHRAFSVKVARCEKRGGGAMKQLIPDGIVEAVNLQQRMQIVEPRKLSRRCIAPLFSQGRAEVFADFRLHCHYAKASVIPAHGKNIRARDRGTPFKGNLPLRYCNKQAQSLQETLA